MLYNTSRRPHTNLCVAFNNGASYLCGALSLIFTFKEHDQLWYRKTVLPKGLQKWRKKCHSGDSSLAIPFTDHRRQSRKI